MNQKNNIFTVNINQCFMSMKNYSNNNVRRQDRLLDQNAAVELLSVGEYGVLSLCGVDGAYGIPLSYAWDSECSIYFHCAPEGKKLEYIKYNHNASFAIVGHTKVLSAKFTTEYESLIISGVVELVEDGAEKMNALELILDKYSPTDKVMGMKYAQKSLSKTVILKLTIKAVSGKSKK